MIVLTANTPDMEEMSRPNRPPPMQANEPTMYYDLSEDRINANAEETHTGFDAILALY